MGLEVAKLTEAQTLYRLVDSPLQPCPHCEVLAMLEESPVAEGFSYRLHTVSESLLAPDGMDGVVLQRTVVQAIGIGWTWQHRVCRG